MSIAPDDPGTPAAPVETPQGATPVEPVDDGGGAGPRDEILAEVESLRAYKDQALREKSNYEQLRRDHESLLQRMGQPTPPTAVDPQRERFERGRLQLEAAAAQEGNEWAATVLSVMNAIPQMQNQLQSELRMSRFDENERAQIESIQREQYEKRGDRISPETAKELLRLRSPQPQARPAAAVETQPRPIGTRMVPAPAQAQEQETMTYSQFGAGTRNSETRESYQARQRSGKIRLVPG